MKEADVAERRESVVQRGAVMVLERAGIVDWQSGGSGDRDRFEELAAIQAQPLWPVTLDSRLNEVLWRCDPRRVQGADAKQG
jgi:hypothetical protein